MHAIAEREADEIEARWPKVLRRVQGYNLDMVQPRGRLAISRTCWSAPKARSPIRGASISSSRRCRGTRPWACATSRPSTTPWRRRSTSSSSRPTAVELVDRTMIELARGNAGVPRHRRAVPPGRSGRDPAGGVRRRGPRRAAAQAQAARRADGRPRPPGQRGRDHRRRAAARRLGGAQGGPQHHDVDEGRRQAGVLHRGLRGAAGASRRIHRRADAGVRASTAPRHLVRARLGRARCTCGRCST